MSELSQILRFIQVAHNGWQYAEAGISKLQLVKPLKIWVNVQKFKFTTIPGLRILRVRGWLLFIVRKS